MNNKLLPSVAGLLLSLGGLALAPLASADAIDSNPTLTSGPLTFFNFMCTDNGVSAGGLCPNISVIPYLSTTPPDPLSGEYGIQIQGVMNSLAGAQDLIVTYYETTSTGVFTDAEMWFNGTPDTGISETIIDNATNVAIGQLVVSNPPLSGLGAYTMLTGDATSIYIDKDIMLSNGGTISQIDQNFSLTPEPATLALFGAGLLGCALALGRRRRSLNP